MSAPPEKPILVATAFDASGHVAGLAQISAHLIKKGYIVYFITGPSTKPTVEKTGAFFVENLFPWEEVMAATGVGKYHDNASIMKYIFGDNTLTAHRVLKETLERIHKDHPGREVVILHEAFSGALGPFEYGAPLPEGYSTLPKAINFHTSVYPGPNGSVPPFGAGGLPYDPTPDNLALWQSMYDAMVPVMADITNHYNDLYKTLGATRPMPGPFLDDMMRLGNLTVLATSPSLEYPPCAHNPRLRFIGGLPLKPIDQGLDYPSWWPTITANAALPAHSPDKKKVIFVTQGTIHLNYEELILPTIAAFADRTDIIVVATLGARGAELDFQSGTSTITTTAPANTFIVDYFPYDAILPYADAFVSNAGYGGFMHGVMNGVPMVLAGAVADKADVCARAEYAGIAVGLRTQNPGEEVLRAAVDRVLGEPAFKERALQLQKENQEMDALGKIESIIEELVGKV